MDRIRAFFIVPFKLQLLPIKGVAPLRHTPGKGNEHIALPTLFVRAACIAPDNVGFAPVVFKQVVPA